jgi:hypothetical protein
VTVTGCGSAAAAFGPGAQVAFATIAAVAAATVFPSHPFDAPPGSEGGRMDQTAIDLTGVANGSAPRARSTA